MITAPVGFASLADALVVQLQVLLELETVGEAMLALVVRTCANPLVQAALDEHREQASAQIARLGQILDVLGGLPERRQSGLAAGLAEDLRALAAAEGDPDARDAALIAGIQVWKHAEIAAYGTARAWASRLGRPEVVALLSRSLEEEVVCDERLSVIAEHLVNLDAS